MPEAVIVDAIRTPIGRAMKGTLRSVRADDLAAIPLRALVERNPGVDFSETDDIMMGCGFPEGEQGYNIGRNAQLLAGIDHHVPAVTVSRFCASSLQTIRMAFHAIKAGEGDQYIAAGVECVSRGAAQTLPVEELAHRRVERRAVQRVHPHGAHGRERGRALQRQPRVPGRVGGDLAAARTARRATAATSTARSSASTSSRPRRARQRRRGAHGHARRRATRRARPWRRSRELKPVFRPDGTVTAGNACPLNDGAAAVLVMSEDKARELGLEPRARIVASSVAAIRPEIMGLGPIPAIRAVLEAAGMTIEDMDVVEMNEAFAAQVVPCRDELGIDPDKLNPNGGAIALGHPFGMTGARIMTTLLNNLDAVEGRLGLESMCVAGGMGQAMIVERLN